MNRKDGFFINKEFDALIAGTILRRHWWYPFASIMIFVFFSWLFLRYTSPTYESTSIIQLDEQDNAKEIIDVQNVNVKENNLIATVELIKSQLLFERAIELINFNVSHFSKGEILTEEKYNSGNFNVQPYELKDSSLVGVPINLTLENNTLVLDYVKNGIAKSVRGKIGGHLTNEDFNIVVKSSNVTSLKEELANNELYFEFNNKRQFAERLLPNLIVNPLEPEAKTIQISFRGNNPILCKDIVESVTKSFMSFSDEAKQKSSEKILSFIEQQLDSLSNELKTSKDSLMLYQKKSNMADPENVSANISDKIQKHQELQFELQEEIRSLQTVDYRLKSEPNRLEVYRLLPEMLGKSYEQALSTQISQLHDLLEKKEDLLYKVTDDNAEIKNINAKIKIKLSSIRKSIDTILERLYASLANHNKKIGGLESEYLQLPEKKMEFNRLQNIQELNEKYFTLLMEKKVQYAISDAGYASNNRVLLRPIVSDSPYSPNSKIIYGTFILTGLFIGISLMLLRYFRYNEINELDELKKLLPEQATILGGIPFHQMEATFSQLVVNLSPRSSISEMMRKVRTNLSYIYPNYQTIAISSSISGEGKTFVALNLAGIIAMSGKKTIILDLDMRKPKIHIGLNAPNVNGMSNLIVGQVEIKDCVQHSVIENLDFITAGPIPPNPSELLLSDNFRKIKEDLAGIYDVIIIDNPPIGLVSDGVRILTDAHIPIYVFKAHYSKRNFALRVKELFEMKQINNLNVILNGVRGSASGYGYGYGYGGYYNSYYDEGDSKKRWWKTKWKKFFKKS